MKCCVYSNEGQVELLEVESLHKLVSDIFEHVSQVWVPNIVLFNRRHVNVLLVENLEHFAEEINEIFLPFNHLAIVGDAGINN